MRSLYERFLKSDRDFWRANAEFWRDLYIDDVCPGDESLAELDSQAFARSARPKDAS
jgi:hypothetical protein